MKDIDFNLDPDIVSTDGSFVAIQSKVVQYLRAIDEFSNVEQIFYEDSLELIAEIEKALSSGMLSMCVSIGKAIDDKPTVPGILALDPCEIIVRILENPTVNRGEGGTGLTVGRAGELVMRKLKLERINNGYLGKPRIDRANTPDGSGMVGKDVTFTLSTAI